MTNLQRTNRHDPTPGRCRDLRKQSAPELRRRVAGKPPFKRQRQQRGAVEQPPATAASREDCLLVDGIVHRLEAQPAQNCSLGRGEQVGFLIVHAAA